MSMLYAVLSQIMLYGFRLQSDKAFLAQAHPSHALHVTSIIYVDQSSALDKALKGSSFASGGGWAALVRIKVFTASMIPTFFNRLCDS
jgi:hypothetical protein